MDHPCRWSAQRRGENQHRRQPAAHRDTDKSDALGFAAPRAWQVHIRRRARCLDLAEQPVWPRHQRAQRFVVTDLRFDLFDLHHIIDASVEERPGGLIVHAVIPQPIKHRGAVDTRQGRPFGVPVHIFGRVTQRGPDFVGCAPDRLGPIARVHRQRKEGCAPAHRLFVGHSLDAKAHACRHLVPKPVRHIPRLHPRHHRRIAPRVIGQGQIDGPTRAHRPGHRYVNPSILRGGTKACFGPSIKGHMHQGSVQKGIFGFGIGGRHRRLLARALQCWTN
mmetsp:Transcript_29002/g.55632  ORF Transcript_29002/g.55632 Transcript_29002/m.55632 type:complete len:277 (+) Transcript_29002:1432-2262(+)